MRTFSPRVLIPFALTLCAAPFALQDVTSVDKLAGPQNNGLTKAQVNALSFIETQPFEGTTLMSNEEQLQLARWANRPFQKWELAFRKTTDGSTSADFHNAVDDLGPSIAVIQLPTGTVFGGYNPAGWDSISGYNGSPEGQGFLFSFLTNRRFPYAQANVDRAVYDHPSYGPTFGGGHDFYVNASLDLQYTNFPFDYGFEGTNQAPNDAACLELTGLNRLVSSTISEIEVWVPEGTL